MPIDRIDSTSLTFVGPGSAGLASINISLYVIACNHNLSPIFSLMKLGISPALPRKKRPLKSKRFLTRKQSPGRRTLLLRLSGFPRHTIGVRIVRTPPPQAIIFPSCISSHDDAGMLNIVS